MITFGAFTSCGQNANPASCTTGAVTLALGDCVVVAMRGPVANLSVTDDLGNAYSIISGMTDPGQSLWVCFPVTHAGPATITGSNTTSGMNLMTQVYHGVGAIGQANTTTGNQTSAAAFTSIPIATSANNVIVTVFRANSVGANYVISPTAPSVFRGTQGTTGTSTQLSLVDATATASGALGNSGLVALSTSWGSASVELVEQAAVPSFTLSANPATNAAFQGANTNTTISINPTGGFSNPVTLSVSGLPAGASTQFSINPATTTSVLTLNAGLTTPPGTYAITITGVSGSLTEHATFNFQVYAVAPIISTTQPPPGTEGQPYNTTITVTGGLPPYTSTLASGALPAGITLGAANSNGIHLAGTPTVFGTFTFTVQVCDSQATPGCATSTTYTLTLVSATAPVTIAPGQPPAAQQGVAYSETIAVTGGIHPYTSTLVSGNLPPGITLAAPNNGGIRFTGTPTNPGNFTFVVQVCDADSPPECVTSASYTLTVEVAAQPVTVWACGCQQRNSPLPVEVTVICGRPDCLRLFQAQVAFTPLQFNWQVAHGGSPTMVKSATFTIPRAQTLPPSPAEPMKKP